MTNTKRHPHADVIIAWAEGQEIEYYSNTNDRWMQARTPIFSETKQYRIKPVRVYPVTSLTENQLNQVFKECHSTTVSRSCVAVANAAIKQYIIDTEANNG